MNVFVNCKRIQMITNYSHSTMYFSFVVHQLPDLSLPRCCAVKIMLSCMSRKSKEKTALSRPYMQVSSLLSEQARAPSAALADSLGNLCRYLLYDSCHKHTFREL
ncbi:hypothetical protein XENOCAPTIV_007998 [Xenoophorus captivus]|uniref:Uncharacterized protein n=1 Tax=Xenoophorus captivus TaxID=1517983 RepID=A0ABV0R4K4_9TELE